MSPDPSTPEPRISDRVGPDRGDLLMSARPLAEYHAMFGLEDEDLLGRLLDCPGGGASFLAETDALGVDVIAVDPAYSAPADELGPHVREEVDRGNQYVRDNRQRYVWTWFRDVDHHRQIRIEGARRFAEHYARHPERYLAAALPDLPFARGEFDLTLSSHLLFTYADRLDLDFHLAAATEMVRVTRGEVRLYPLVTMYSQPYPHLDELRAELAERAIDSETRQVPYEFQVGADRTLVLTLRA